MITRSFGNLGLKSDMNIKVYTTGGGIFSKFMVAVQWIDATVSDIDSIDSIYLDINRNKKGLCKLGEEWHKNVGNTNPFNYALTQDDTIKFDEVLYPTPLPSYLDIINVHNLNRLKTIVSKLKIKDTVINKLKPLKGKTLGVHVRLTDMEIWHPENGVGIITNTFYEATKKTLQSESFDSIFVSSDNDESIEYFKEKMDIVYNNVNNRVNGASDGSKQMDLQLSRSGDETFWVDSFVDMLSLSRCNKLIYRVSNFSNASVLFSKTITDTIKI